MTPTRLTQHHVHNPPETIGDCWRTAIACMLGCSRPDRVPHWAELYWETPEPERSNIIMKATRDWLKNTGFGYGFIELSLAFKTVEDVLRYMGEQNSDQFYLLSGLNPLGIPHVVICKGGEFWHDTNPGQGFLAGPLTDPEVPDYFVLNFITPL